MSASKWMTLALLAAVAAAAQADDRPFGPPPRGQGGPGGPGGMMPPPPRDGRGPRDAASGDAAAADAAGTDDGAADAAPPPACDRGRHGAGGHRGPPPADPRRVAGLLGRTADADASGDIAADEIEAFLAALGADEAGVISMDALIALLPAPPADAPQRDEGDIAAKLTRDLDHDADGAVEIEDVQWFLALLDKDADGAVSADEVKPPKPLHGKARGAAVALARAADADESHDVSAEEWQAFLDGLVVDGDGAVSLGDLASKLPAPKHGGSADEDTARRDAHLVKCFDRDGDGVVEVSDLQSVFDELDRSADGALTKREAKAKRKGKSRK